MFLVRSVVETEDTEHVSRRVHFAKVFSDFHEVTNELVDQLQSIDMIKIGTSTVLVGTNRFGHILTNNDTQDLDFL